ncbi:MAG: response regulator [Anaerolineales bacterium]|nr:response regulator [Anaerolineales bacterium]
MKGERKGHILVVDDNRLNRLTLANSLQQQGHSVELAEHGAQALEMMCSKPFDLVLLDILMPEMDGFQVLEQMHSDPVLRELPVIVISALDELDSVVRGIEMGAEDYLPKPFNPILLQARINACLEKKVLRDQEQAYLQQIQVEREKAERLLLNILPKPVAEKLKRGEKVIAESFSNVTVLIADIVKFTRISATMTPDELILLLNDIFSAFDELAALYGLEKIKTVGDNYLIVGGLPTPRSDHAEAIADMALGMQEIMQQTKWRHGQPVEIRIGVHQGPVVAGVIGRQKFIYDLWGVTVNIASRMESHGVPGRIHVSAQVYAALHDTFSFEERGLVPMKGLGKMPTYFLLGRK